MPLRQVQLRLSYRTGRDDMVKGFTEDGWSHEHIELLPLNRDYNPIIVTPHEAPEMVVAGEWVATID